MYYIENVPVEFITGEQRTADKKKADQRKKDRAQNGKKKKKLPFLSAYTLQERTVCPECGYPVISWGDKPRTIYHYFQAPNTRDKRIYEITLHQKRFRCLNKADGPHTSLASELGYKTPYTTTLKHHIAWYYLNQKKQSYATVGDYCSFSPPTVAKIIDEVAVEVNTNFLPHGDVEYLQLHEFSYQGKDCIYLAKVTRDRTPVILAFFGHDNAEEKLARYLEFHWRNSFDDKKTKDRRRPPNNIMFAAVDYGSDFDSILKQYIPNCFPCWSRDSIIEWMNTYKTDHNDGSYSDLCELIDEIQALMENHVDARILQTWMTELKKEIFIDASIKNDKERKWEYKLLSKNWMHKDIHRNVIDHLSPIWEELTDERQSLYFIGYQEFDVSMSAFNVLIDYYNHQNLPFNMMTLRILYSCHGDYLFTEDTIGHISYDSDTDTLYREPVMSETEKINKQVKEELGIDEDEPYWDPSMFI